MSDTKAAIAVVDEVALSLHIAPLEGGQEDFATYLVNGLRDLVVKGVEANRDLSLVLARRVDALEGKGAASRTCDRPTAENAILTAKVAILEATLKAIREENAKLDRDCDALTARVKGLAADNERLVMKAATAATQVRELEEKLSQANRQQAEWMQVDPRRWIPCSERMPTEADGDYVLITDAEGHVYRDRPSGAEGLPETMHWSRIPAAVEQPPEPVLITRIAFPESNAQPAPAPDTVEEPASPSSGSASSGVGESDAPGAGDGRRLYSGESMYYRWVHPDVPHYHAPQVGDVVNAGGMPLRVLEVNEVRPHEFTIRPEGYKEFSSAKGWDLIEVSPPSPPLVFGPETPKIPVFDARTAKAESRWEISDGSVWTFLRRCNNGEALFLNFYGVERFTNVSGDGRSDGIHVIGPAADQPSPPDTVS